MRAPSTPSREPEEACEALRNQPEDRRQVESADLRFRSADRTEGARIDGPVSKRGRRRCFPKAYLLLDDCRTPCSADRRRPLQGPYRPHRQRNPLHHPRQHELGSPRHQGRPRRRGACLGAHAFEDARPERHPTAQASLTNGQVERMNRTIKDATVKRFTSTRPTTSCERTCAPSSTPTTSPDASKPSAPSPHMSSSAKPGLQSHTDSNSARSSK